VNYDQARQIEATGKWNWTTMNDGAIRTAAPCAYPDFEWPSRFDPINLPKPTGRARCDHDTREQAERHHYDDEVRRVRIQKLDLDTLRARHRCAFEGCPRWEDYRAHWPGGYRVDSLCGEHAERSAELRPFVPGMQVIHS